MTECGYKNNPCKAARCPKDCGLKYFLNMIKREKEAHPEEEKIIEKLREKYVEKWNKYWQTLGRGPALGKAFEEWITEEIGLSRKCNKKVNFGVFEFQVDCAIPSAQNPKVILEMKINSDTQHVLAMRSLLDYFQNGKLGYVALYYKPEQRDVINILEDIKRKYESRFNYFFIEGGWSKTLEELKAFCSK